MIIRCRFVPYIGKDNAFYHSSPESFVTNTTSTGQKSSCYMRSATAYPRSVPSHLLSRQRLFVLQYIRRHVGDVGRLESFILHSLRDGLSAFSTFASIVTAEAFRPPAPPPSRQRHWTVGILRAACAPRRPVRVQYFRIYCHVGGCSSSSTSDVTSAILDGWNPSRCIRSLMACSI